jgi:hypothetical protein
LASLPGLPAGKDYDVGVAVGTYNNYQSVAIGGEARVSDHFTVKGGMSHSAFGGMAASVGAGFAW